MSSPNSTEQNTGTGRADWQEYQTSLLELLAPAMCLEVQRNEAVQPFATVEPPNGEDLEKLEDIHRQLAAYLETPCPANPFIAADELPEHVALLKKWIQDNRKNFMGVERENVDLKNLKAHRDNNRHTMDALRTEFLHSFEVLGRCPPVQVIHQPDEDLMRDRKDEYPSSQIDRLSNVGSPMGPSILADIEMTDAIVAPVVSIAQTAKQCRLNSIRERLKSLGSVQEEIQGQLQDIATKMTRLHEDLAPLPVAHQAEMTYAPDEPISEPIYTTGVDRQHRVFRDLTIEIFYEGRSWLFDALREDWANMMMDAHLRSGYPWRQLDLWKRKQGLTAELLAKYLRSLPDFQTNNLPLDYA